MPLPKPLLAEIQEIHAESVARATAAEAIAEVLLLDALRESSDRLALEVAVSIGTTARLVRRRIVSLADDVDQKIRRVTLEAREQAKSLARGQVSVELGRFATTRDGAALLIPRADLQEFDAFEANRVAAALRSAWATSASTQLRQWETRGEPDQDLTRRLRNTAEPLLPRIQTHAAWQAMEAYNHERDETWRLLTEGGGGDGLVSAEPLLPDGWLDRTYNVWSAILDRKTCPVCSDLDGTMVPVGKPWPEGQEIPAHIRCRCLKVTIHVPDEALRKLPGIGIDYAELKADILEHFQKSKLTDLVGLRHAAPFIREALKTSSPETLTRRLTGPRQFIQKGLRRRPRVSPLPFR